VRRPSLLGQNGGMFLGHFGLGFAAKKLDPQLPLGTALFAAQLPDVIWPVLVATGIERVAIAPGDTAFTPLRFESYPISHSLLTVAVWGLALGGAHLARCRRLRSAVVLALLAVSHWVLDWLSHRPDMPLAPGSDRRFGLGLWNSVPATLLVESLIFAAGVWLYARATTRGRGARALAALVGTLVVLYAANAFGPPPPSVAAIAASGIIAAPLLFVWGNWVDRRRAAPA
jgi:hypothetical protein